MPKYLIAKTVSEPEQYLPGELGEAYKHSLPLLEGSEETLMETDEGVIKVRDIPEEVEQEQLAELESDRRPHILTIEPDYEAKAPEPVEVQASRMTAESGRRLYDIPQVWERGSKGKGQRIAIIDTGIHEKLAERLGSRVVVKADVFDDEDWRDTHSLHGTWCTSTIAAIAPEAEILSYKGLSTRTGSGSYSGIISCMDHARKNGATVLSMSLGGPASSALDSAVNAAANAGVIVCVAAGNEQRGTPEYVADKTSPARAAGAVCCAAADSDLRVADFSNTGKTVDVSGLGVAVQCEDPDIAPGWYSGTSMSAPHVAGTAALVHDRKAIEAGCKDTGEPVTGEGRGFVDALAAYLKVNPEPSRPTGPVRMGKARFDKLSAARIDAMGDEVVITLRGKNWRRTVKI